MTELTLTAKKRISFEVDQPFNFEKTFYSPSHFDSKLELYDKEHSLYYSTMNFGYVVLGLKFSMHNGKLLIDIFSEQKLNKDLLCDLKDEFRFRLSLENSDFEFYNTVHSLKNLAKSRIIW